MGALGRVRRGDLGRRGIECVYWFEDGSWHRAPYPDDLAAMTALVRWS
ncbi:hypothetical protein [Streptomyces sp. NPDC059918]